MSLQFAKCRNDKGYLKKLRNSPVQFPNGRRVLKVTLGDVAFPSLHLKHYEGGGVLGKVGLWERTALRGRAKEVAVLMSL